MHVAPTRIYILASILEPVPVDRLFPQPRPLEIELGSGDGSFLIQYAQAHPDRNFIGVERLLGRLRKTDRKAQRAGLENVALIRIEAGYFFEYLLPPGSIQAVHIYFPDPWPKRKHRRHRLVNERFPELARRVLAPGGWVYLRTDDADYFGQMTQVFSDHPAFGIAPAPPGLEAMPTDFERDFVARGLPVYRAAYQSRSQTVFK